MNRYGKGWFNESFRHKLAAKGIQTQYYVRKRKKRQVTGTGLEPKLGSKRTQKFIRERGEMMSLPQDERLAFLAQMVLLKDPEDKQAFAVAVQKLKAVEPMNEEIAGINAEIRRFKEMRKEFSDAGDEKSVESVNAGLTMLENKKARLKDNVSAVLDGASEKQLDEAVAFYQGRMRKTVTSFDEPVMREMLRSGQVSSSAEESIKKRLPVQKQRRAQLPSVKTQIMKADEDDLTEIVGRSGESVRSAFNRRTATQDEIELLVGRGKNFANVEELERAKFLNNLNNAKEDEVSKFRRRISDEVVLGIAPRQKRPLVMSEQLKKDKRTGKVTVVQDISSVGDLSKKMVREEERLASIQGQISEMQQKTAPSVMKKQPRQKAKAPEAKPVPAREVAKQMKKMGVQPKKQVEVIEKKKESFEVTEERPTERREE